MVNARPVVLIWEKRVGLGRDSLAVPSLRPSLNTSLTRLAPLPSNYCLNRKGHWAFTGQRGGEGVHWALEGRAELGMGG